jgi:hypothetical protein
MLELGIEGPRRQEPGGNRDFPVYWTKVQPPEYTESSAAPFPQESPTIRRRRADSRAATIDSVPDFQDVYDGRRPDRLRSIRATRDDSRLSSPVERRESRSSAGQRNTRALFQRQATISSAGNSMV